MTWCNEAQRETERIIGAQVCARPATQQPNRPPNNSATDPTIHPPPTSFLLARIQASLISFRFFSCSCLRCISGCREREEAVSGEGKQFLTEQIASQYSPDKAVLEKVDIPMV